MQTGLTVQRIFFNFQQILRVYLSFSSVFTECVDRFKVKGSQMMFWEKSFNFVEQFQVCNNNKETLFVNPVLARLILTSLKFRRQQKTTLQINVSMMVYHRVTDETLIDKNYNNTCKASVCKFVFQFLTCSVKDLVFL